MPLSPQTYNVDKQVPDSAGTATAMFTGVKSRYYMLGLEASAQFGKCDPEQDRRRMLPSIMDWAQVRPQGLWADRSKSTTTHAPGVVCSCKLQWLRS